MRKSTRMSKSTRMRRSAAIWAAVVMAAALGLGACAGGGTGSTAGAGDAAETTAGAGDTAGTAAETTAGEADTAETAAEAAAGTTAEAGAADTAGEAAGQAGAKEPAGSVPKPGMPLKAGDQAPDFTAQLVDGTTLTLSDLQGKPVLINFWATWCGPCVMEMPAFEKLQADYGEEIAIVAVNCGDDKATVTDFAEENGYTFPIALDEAYEISMLYPTNGIPYTVILDEEGVVTQVSTGAADAETMYEHYRQALGLEEKEAS